MRTKTMIRYLFHAVCTADQTYLSRSNLSPILDKPLDNSSTHISL